VKSSIVFLRIKNHNLIHERAGMVIMAHPFNVMDGEFKAKFTSAKPFKELINCLVSVDLDGSKFVIDPI